MKFGRNSTTEKSANLLFFTRGERTENIWYYDLSHVKVTKKKPLTLQDFEEFFQLLPSRADSEWSWTVTRQEIEARQYDLKAVNPYAKNVEGTETPEELLDFIELKGQEVADALAILRSGKASVSG
jgi:type I restriction enzyme M protein